jgi:hypothetical protein
MRIILYSVNQNDVTSILHGADNLVAAGTTGIPYNSGRNLPSSLNDQDLWWWQFKKMPQEMTELSVGILMKSAANEGHNKSTCDRHLQHSKGENEVELSVQPVCLM